MARGGPRSGNVERVEPDRFAALFDLANHDLRQPLHSLGLLIHVLNNADTGGGLSRQVELLGTALESIAMPFEEFSALAKLETGRGSTDLRAIDLEPILTGLERSFAGRAAMVRSPFRVRAGQQAVTSEPRLLAHVLECLVTTAFRYPQRTGVLVGCRARSDCCRVEVWVFGAGIHDDYLVRHHKFYEVQMAELFAAAIGCELQDRGLGDRAMVLSCRIPTGPVQIEGS